MTSPHDDNDNVMDLLTAYALDALEPDEVAQVVALLERRPELRGTLAELRNTAGQLPYALPDVDPPPELRQRVLDRAVGRTAPTPRLAPAPERLVNRARAWLVGLGGLAAVALLAAVLGWSQATSAQTELARVRAELDVARARQEQVAQVLLRAETLAALSGTGGSGTVLRTPQGEALLAAQLPPLQPGRVYQLWLIEGDDPPASGGTFTVDEQGQGLLALASPQVLAASTFAVTDEPGPSGSPGPTTEVLIAGSPAS